MSKNKLKIVVLSVIFALFSLHAPGMPTIDQTPPEPGNKAPGVPPPPGLPIDFGVSALLVAGLGLGIRFLSKKET